jgi:hypothetical protein
MERASTSATARDIIREILRNMREGLEPLHYSTLPPAIYHVYLHPNDMERLRAIVPRIVVEARQALDAELETLNKSSMAESVAERLKLNRFSKRESPPKVSQPEGGWQVRILENTDDDVEPGDIVIHSELAMPAKDEYGSGSMTKRIATRRMAGNETVSQSYAPAPAAPAAPIQPDGEAESVPTTLLPKAGTARMADPAPTPDVAAFATIQYQDAAGPKTFRMTKDQIVVGRGGRDYWTDLKLETFPDVSREHFRLRRDPASGQFFLKDLSRLGTTINGERAPSSIDFAEGQKRDKEIETPVPAKARIGLADVLYLDFEASS